MFPMCCAFKCLCLYICMNEIYIYLQIHTNECFKWISNFFFLIFYVSWCFLPVTVFVFAKTSNVNDGFLVPINLNVDFLVPFICWLKQLEFGEKCEEATAARWVLLWWSSTHNLPFPQIDAICCMQNSNNIHCQEMGFCLFVCFQSWRQKSTDFRKK